MAPDQDDDPADEGSVLSPEELDITDDERVVEIDEGRYVISSDDEAEEPPAAVDAAEVVGDDDAGAETAPPDSDADPDPDQEPDPAAATGDGSGPRVEPAVGEAGDASALTEGAVHEWLEAHVAETGSQYGFDITAAFEGTVYHQELFSNDVVMTFENLLIWYAQHVGDNTPVEEVLGILLLEANTSVRYPPETIRELAADYGLTAEDTIADLIDAVDGDEGVDFPP